MLVGVNVDSYRLNKADSILNCILAARPCNYLWLLTLLGKAKLEREISDGKNKIPHIFLGRKI